MTPIPSEVGRQMRSDEKPRWIGYPMPGKYALKQGIPMFLFAIPWTGFSASFEVGAIRSGSAFALLWGVPFVIIGLRLLASPLWEYWRARRTIYVVSDQRVLILGGLLRPSTQSFAPSDIGPLDVDAADDGSGSVIFSEHRTRDAEGGWNVEKIGFIAVPRVREAERHIVLLKNRTMDSGFPRPAAGNAAATSR